MRILNFHLGFTCYWTYSESLNRLLSAHWRYSPFGPSRTTTPLNFQNTIIQDHWRVYIETFTVWEGIRINSIIKSFEKFFVSQSHFSNTFPLWRQSYANPLWELCMYKWKQAYIILGTSKYLYYLYRSAFSHRSKSQLQKSKFSMTSFSVTSYLVEKLAC